jgi:hypothetical protein
MIAAVTLPPGTNAGHSSAGWFPDPMLPGMLRWWDGTAWSSYTYSIQQVPWAMATAPDPARDLTEEAKKGRLAAIGLGIGEGVYAIEGLALAILIGPIIHQVRINVDQISQNSSANISPFAGVGGRVFGTILALDFANLAVFAAQILFMIWVHQSATLAQRAGLPARHSPLWAVLGFFIPIVSLWFPAQAVTDLFPANDPARRLVGWWWASYLLRGMMFLPIGVAAFFSTPAAIIVAVAVAVIPITTAWTGRRLIAAALQAHRQLVA